MNALQKIIKELQSLKRYNHDVFYDSSVLEDNEEGELVKWEDIEKVIKEVSALYNSKDVNGNDICKDCHYTVSKETGQLCKIRTCDKHKN